jgi:hypothetical protein
MSAAIQGAAGSARLLLGTSLAVPLYGSRERGWTTNGVGDPTPPWLTQSGARVAAATLSSVPSSVDAMRCPGPDSADCPAARGERGDAIAAGPAGARDA